MESQYKQGTIEPNVGVVEVPDRYRSFSRRDVCWGGKTAKPGRGLNDFVSILSSEKWQL
jgi:hypothetical protein